VGLKQPLPHPKGLKIMQKSLRKAGIFAYSEKIENGGMCGFST